MINVNQITAQLARMPDQTLQRYAAMHKEDPYVLSLALAESNRRKEMRSGAQMQAPEQPKVVDQAVAGMGAPMPETVGIGQLPAQNLQNMATGGIVAFDEGGEVPRYQYGGVLSGTEYGIPGMTQSTLLQDALAKLNEGRPLSSQEKALLFSAAPATAAADVALSPLNLVRRLVRNPLDTSPLPSMTPVSDARAKALGLDKEQPQPAAKPATAPAATPTAADLGPVPGSKDTDILGGGVAQTAPPKPAPGASTGTVAAPAGLYALATTPEQMRKEMKAMGITSGVPDEITAGIAALQTEEENAARANAERIKAEQAARGQAFTGLEERLKTREGRVSKMEADQGPMALLQAGLAIMGGTSPYALANIGAGAQVGVKSYSEGLDKLDRARDKLDDMFAKIEEVRRNESRMDSKELREAELAISKTKTEAKRLGLSALEKNWGFDRQDANKGLELLFRNRQTVIEQEGAMQRTQAQINAVPADLRTYQGLGEAAPGSAVRTGFDLAKTAAMRERAIETWSKLAYPAGGIPNEAFLRRYPDPQAYAEEALRQNTGTGVTPGGGTPMLRTR